LEAIMTSPAKIAAAIQNAQKSTGPRTEEGKRKSRMNALKHGLTAKTVLLPEEDPAEFKQLMVGWFDSIRPQDGLEASLVERGAYSVWQLDRANRSESAQLWLKADRHADDQENLVGKEVGGLVRRLLAAPNGRPAAFPCTKGPDDDPDDGCKRGGAIDPDDHPSELVRRLVTSGLGCQRLLEIWSELSASLEKDGWQTPERFRAFRLLGIQPKDTYMTTELASILRACQTIDPDGGSVVEELWNEVVPREGLPALKAKYQREIAHLPALDQDAGRQYLREIITRKTTELEARLERHQERAQAEELLAPHRMAFDDSREGRLLRRYENACKQFFLRCLDEVRMHREERAERAKQGVGARYLLPPSAWFEGLEKEATSEIDARRAAVWQQWQAESRARARELEGTVAGGTCTKSEIINSKSQTLNPKGGEELDAVAGNGAEIMSAIGVEHAALRQKCRSEDGALEQDGEHGQDIGGAPTSRAEVSSPIDAVRSAERDERTAMETASVAEVARRLVTQRSRVVRDGASNGAGLVTNNLTLSNKERKRRRREERKRIRELSVVSCPLSVV
jgi:hypothetical protein